MLRRLAAGVQIHPSLNADRLKVKLQPHLYATRFAGGGVLAELGVDLLVVRIEPGPGVHPAELLLVERVLHLPAELETTGAITPDWKVFEDGDVPVVDARAAQRVLGRVADAEIRAVRRPHDLGAEITLLRPLPFRQIGIAGQNHAAVHAGAG